MIINHNMNAMNAHRNMGMNTNAAGKSMEKLSSGLKINRAGDDAAGLAISEKMRGQIRGLDQAASNAQDGISLIQTAEGALNETHSILQRMRELSVQSANDTTTLTDRREIQKEMNQLIEEVDRIATDTQFNNKNLLDGTLSSKFHIGANQGQSITLTITNMQSSNLGTAAQYSSENSVTSVADLNFSGSDASVTIGNTTIVLEEDYSDNLEGLAAKLNSAFSQTEGVTVTAQGSKLVYKGATDFNTPTYGGTESAKLGTAVKSTNATPGGALLSTLKVVDADTATTGGVLDQSGADAAIKVVNNSIEKVSAERSKLGAYQNRLEHTIANLGTSSENLTAAESRIRDVDMAKEMMNFSKNNILSQAAQAMISQANQQPQQVLQLLR